MPARKHPMPPAWPNLPGNYRATMSIVAGKMPAIERIPGLAITEKIEDADTILINHEGLIAPETGRS